MIFYQVMTTSATTGKWSRSFRPVLGADTLKILMLVLVTILSILVLGTSPFRPSERTVPPAVANHPMLPPLAILNPASVNFRCTVSNAFISPMQIKYSYCLSSSIRACSDCSCQAFCQGICVEIIVIVFPPTIKSPNTA